MNELEERNSKLVQAEVLDGDLMISGASFQVDMSGIQADVRDLTDAIDQALTVYGETLVEQAEIDAMNRATARENELALSREIRSADELRRKLNRDYRVPLDNAKIRYDELMGPVIELHGAFKQRRIELEDAERERKVNVIRETYERIAPEIALPATEGAAAPVPFERLFEMLGSKWLNKGTGLDSIELEIGGIARIIADGERRIDASGITHALEAKLVLWQTFDVEAALARDRELCMLEERQQALEAARQRAERAVDQAQPAREPNASAENHVSVSSADRKPRVMLIDGATDDECRQIGAFCASLNITGRFKGPAFYEAVKSLVP